MTATDERVRPIYEEQTFDLGEQFQELPETYEPSDILRFFEWEHLHPVLAEVSRQFHQLAVQIDRYIPNSAEKSVALRKLLESKDAAVRSVLDLI